MNCKACGLDHSPRENCGVAKRKAEYLASLECVPDSPVPHEPVPEPEKKLGPNKRWAREEYNRYQREYMKKRRDAKRKTDSSTPLPAPTPTDKVLGCTRGRGTQAG